MDDCEKCEYNGYENEYCYSCLDCDNFRSKKDDKLNAALEREKELRQKLDTRDESLVHYQTELSLAEEREKVLEEALERARYDLDGIGDYGRPLLSIERIDEAIARVKAMREGKE